MFALAKVVRNLPSYRPCFGERVSLSHLHPNAASVRVLGTGGAFVCAGVRISLDTYSEERMESTSPKGELRLSPCLVRDGQGSLVLVSARHAEKGEQEALPAQQCRAQLWCPQHVGVRSPSQHVQSSQIRIVRAERRRAMGRRAELQPRGAGRPVFCTEFSVPTAPMCSWVSAPHRVPSAAPYRHTPPGTTATVGHEQPPLSTGASPQLREPGLTPAAAPHAWRAVLRTPAPLRAGPDTSSHGLCLENHPTCHGAPGDRPLPAQRAAQPARPHPSPHGCPTRPAGCCGTGPATSSPQGTETTPLPPKPIALILLQGLEVAPAGYRLGVP